MANPPTPLEADDPYARRTQTFPHLNAEMAGRVARYGTEVERPAGAVLFRHGDRGVDFYLVLDGAVEIYDTDEHGRDKVLTTHDAGQFTGELDLFNDREVIINARTAAPSRLVRIDRMAFRRMVAAEPDVGEIIMRSFILRRVGVLKHAQGGVVLIGPRHRSDTLRLEQFMTRNAYPHRLIDTEAEIDAGGFLECFELTAQDLPVVVLTSSQKVLRNPSNAEVADALGLTETLDPNKVYDLAVVGAGPAGLAAAVYGASEGLGVIVLEGLAPGGQAGTSSKIENYLGFPTGISGQALAGRAQVQAQKFGARLAVSRKVQALHCDDDPYALEMEDGRVVRARAVVVATGARYRKLALENYDRFEGQGIHYAATGMEALLCTDAEAVVVGGGNSAGQAAVYLSQTSSHVHVLVRGEGLAATMSDYLVQRLETSPKITIRPFTEVVGLEGEESLSAVVWRNRKTGAEERREVSGLFVMIGAAPNTDWLDGCLDLDPQGFVRTGRTPDGEALASPYQTTRPGIYAVGDVRSGSVKRVASGVGEGSVVVQAIHAYLADHTAKEMPATKVA